jgi:hypothetical protein
MQDWEESELGLPFRAEEAAVGGDGRPFRVAFTLAVVAAGLNRAVSSPINDFAVFIVVGLVAFLVQAVWPLVVVGAWLRPAASTPKKTSEQGKEVCPCCGQPLSGRRGDDE